jgi:hypothetical protein
MPIPEETAGRGLQAGEYREQLGRAARATFYLRVLFSTFLLIHAGFGPGLLLRFPVTSVGVTIEPLAQFYAFRPVIYALLFVALVCVLAALCRRATGLFEAEFAEDTGPADPGAEQKRYLKLLRPSPTPFVLSGNIAVDLTIFVAALLAYAFWIVILAETAPSDMVGYQVGGIVLGSYGLFAALIITGLVWLSTARRLRRLARDGSKEADPRAT